MPTPSVGVKVLCVLVGLPSIIGGAAFHAVKHRLNASLQHSKQLLVTAFTCIGIGM